MKREMKNAFDRLSSRYDRAKKINSEQEKRATEITKTETQKRKKSEEKRTVHLRTVRQGQTF